MRAISNGSEIGVAMRFGLSVSPPHHHTFTASVISVIAIGSLAAFSLPAKAQLTFYSTRTAFNSANPGLPVEGFQKAHTGTASFTGPLNSSTSNSSFLPGDILPGISISDNPGPDSGGMFVAAAGQSTNPTTAIGSNSPNTDSLDIAFSPQVFAVGLDMFQNINGGSQSSGTLPYVVSIFGTSGLLGTQTVNVAPNGGSFFGVSSLAGSGIVRVNISNTSAFEVIDNVAFGTPTIVSTTAPEPSSLALILPVILPVLGVAGMAVQKQRRGKWGK